MDFLTLTVTLLPFYTDDIYRGRPCFVLFEGN